MILSMSVSCFAKKGESITLLYSYFTTEIPACLYKTNVCTVFVKRNRLEWADFVAENPRPDFIVKLYNYA